MRTRLALLFAFAPVVLAVDAAAQCSAHKLLASDSHAAGRFGYSVSLSNGRALVGAEEASLGAAYVFENGVTGWTETQKLVPTVPVVGTRFGISVCLDGDRAAVGASLYAGAGSNRGAVYVFALVGGVWTEEALLLSNQPGDGKTFGSSVSLQGDRLVAGEPGLYFGPGAIHVFERIGGTWTHIQKMTKSSTHNLFGWSVSLDGDRIAAGVPFQDGAFHQDEGDVAIYERNAQGVWSLKQTLSSTTGVDGGYFGYSVALEGDRLAISAPYEDGRVDATGAIHVFERNGGVWLEAARITAPDGEQLDGLGYQVSLDGDRIAAGANRDTVGAPGCGSAYVFEREATVWKTLFKQSAAEPTASEEYGLAVAVDGSTLLVGAPAQLTQEAGAAHIYDLDASVVTFCQTSPNSVGDGARISSAGSTSLAQNDFHLACDGAPAGKFGTFFYGPQPKNLPFGNGRLCIGGPFFRLETALSSAWGNGFDWLDFTSPPASSGPGQIFAGSTWYFQYWYRDPSGGGANFNLSNGLQVTFCP